jgi:hypothetical protein
MKKLFAFEFGFLSVVMVGETQVLSLSVDDFDRLTNVCMTVIKAALLQPVDPLFLRPISGLDVKVKRPPLLKNHRFLGQKCQKF